MRDALAWSALRAGLYLGFVATGVVGGSLIGAAVSGPGGLSYLGGLSGALHLAVGAMVILGCYTLLLLLVLSGVRRKLPNAAMKMILLPLLLVPVGLIDLAGTTPPFTLGLLGIQLAYLVTVPMNRIPT